jgi:hypothetical protein
MATEMSAQEKILGENQASGVDWYTNPNSTLAKNWAEQDYDEVSGVKPPNGRRDGAGRNLYSLMVTQNIGE